MSFLNVPIYCKISELSYSAHFVPPKKPLTKKHKLICRCLNRSNVGEVTREGDINGEKNPKKQVAEFEESRAKLLNLSSFTTLL